MRRLVIGVTLGIAALAGAPLAVADGTEALGPPSITIAPGTHLIAAGIGNFKAGRDGISKSFSVDVPAGSTVKQVLLYWEGHATGFADQHCYGGPPGLDETIAVNGVPVTGMLVGGPTNFFLAEYFAGYRKDITSLGLVSPGSNTLTISDMWFLSCFGPYVRDDIDGNDGAGVIVIYDDGGPAATIGVRDGHDLAYEGFSGVLQVTVPQTFTFPPSPVARAASLTTLVASVLGEDAPGPRANQLRITFDVGSPVVIETPWQSNDGFEFDAVNSSVTVPAGASSMTVQPVSGGGNGTPSSLAWIAAGLSVPDVRGGVEVEKTISGRAPTGSESFTFELRQGASTTSQGTVIETKTANAANGGSFAFTDRDPGTYQLCETGVQVSWHSSLSDLPGAFRPDSANDPQGDNSIVCVSFSLGSGETKTFIVENTPPPRGDARTIGYWKNWSSCTGGRQAPVLDETLSAAGGIALGSSLTVTACLKAVRILNKSTIDTGAKKASDRAFNLASQLLAARLNVARAALTCSDATNAIASAHTLLGAVAFTGKAAWKNTMTATQKNQANTLATKLDKYNNNELC